jgi:hypothetical protein
LGKLKLKVRNPMIKYFGELEIGCCFIFQDIKYRKIDNYQGQSLKSNRRVELALNVRVEVCEEQNKY